MNRLLLCGYDEAMAPLGDLTAPIQQAYASRNGYDFKCVRQYPKHIMAYWHKLYIVRDALNEYDEVHWIDSDILITNPDFKLPDSVDKMMVSRDWGVDAKTHAEFSSCNFIVNRKVRVLFDVAVSYENEWPKDKLYDQDALREAAKFCAAKGNPYDYYVECYPRRYFNSVPIEVHESTPEPWQRGDFCAHLTMLPMDRRIELFHNIKARL